MAAIDYSKWSGVYDSDDEKKENQRGAAESKSARAPGRLPATASKPEAAQPARKPSDSATGEMSREEFMQQYSQLINPSGQKQKPQFKFPETLEEQAAVCREAERLKEEGNALYRRGELLEAAKLYEQAVIKFASWYADAFATDEERRLVHSIKLPCHLNLAACSMRLGNHSHAVTHCTQVLQHDKDNAKALYRRGACQMHLGNLDEAQADLRLAAELAPNDAEVRRGLLELRDKRRKYRESVKQMGIRMVTASDEQAGESGGDAVAVDGGTTPASASAVDAAAAASRVAALPVAPPTIASPAATAAALACAIPHGDFTQSAADPRPCCFWLGGVPPTDSTTSSPPATSQQAPGRPAPGATHAASRRFGPPPGTSIARPCGNAPALGIACAAGTRICCPLDFAHQHSLVLQDREPQHDELPDRTAELQRQACDPTHPTLNADSIASPSPGPSRNLNLNANPAFTVTSSLCLSTGIVLPLSLAIRRS